MKSKENEGLEPKNEVGKEELKQTSHDVESYQIALAKNMRIPHLESYDHI